MPQAMPDPAAAAAAMAAQQQQQQQQAPQKDSAADKATSQGAPQTEATKMGEDPIMYEVPLRDGTKRKFTPEQIASTLERYSGLNHKHATMKPVLELADRFMRANPNLTPAQLAQSVEQMVNGQRQQPSPQAQGQQQGQQGKQSNAQISDEMYTKWEEDNASTLPPGYRDMMTAQGNINNQMAQLVQMIRGVMANTQGVADAARMAQGQNQQQQGDAYRRQIANNVDRAQQQLQLPDQAAEDFMIFASERGYTMEDFIDPELTLRVMGDFRNTASSPEMDRLREMAKRRQAYTGALAPSPGGGTGAQADPATETLDRLVNSAMASKTV